MSTVNQDTRWSAAFISYVFGGLPTSGSLFPGSSAHRLYAQRIRDAQKENPPRYDRFELLDPDDKDSYPLRPGDIIIRNFDGQTINFDTDPWTAGETGTHGDIVVSAQSRVTTRQPAGPQIEYQITVIGGNLSNKVLKLDLKFYPYLNVVTDVTSAILPGGSSGQGRSAVHAPGIPRYGPPYFVIIRPKNPFDAQLAVRRAIAEYELWNTNGWTDADPGADARLKEYWRRVGFDYQRTNGSTNAAYVEGTGVSPYIASQQSFHPNIQYELTRRRFASETANTHIPFFRLTSLMSVDRNNLNGQTEAWCPSLGVHGEPEISFDDIYYPRNNKKSTIGYACAVGTNGNIRVPVVVDDANFDQENIPIPGIVDVSMERSLAGPMGVRGGLLKANVKIVAYSIGQINTLMKYFLRPSTRVVLEYGRKSSSTTENNIDQFDWKRKTLAEITDTFTQLITKVDTQRKFIEDYVYNNFGNYEIEIGYVASFQFKYTKNNTFEIELTVHSVQQFEITNIQTGVKSLCPENSTVTCRTSDVREYFDETSAWKSNSFNQLMAKVFQRNYGEIPTLYNTWKDDVVRISDTSETCDEPDAPAGISNEAGTNKNGYFVTWRFFVDVILNDPDYGILSTYNFKPSDSDSLALIRTGILRSTTSPTGEEDDVYKDTNKLIANRVGYHPWLRSTNPGVMLIYNPLAQSIADIKLQEQQIRTVSQNIQVELQDGCIFRRITNSSRGSNFFNLAGNGAGFPGYSSLFNGVWINTNAIVQAFTTTDTISAAISKLLTDMNSATEGYWNLQLLSNDRGNPGMHVIDMALSPKNDNESPQFTPDNETDITSVRNLSNTRYGDVAQNKPKYIYLFNRKTKQLTSDDIGAELLDLNIEYKLPLMTAVQAIAGVGGATETGTLTMGGVEDIKRLSLLKNLYVTCSTPSPSGIEEECANAAYAQEEQNLVKLQQQLATEEEIAENMRVPGDNMALPSSRIGEIQQKITESKARLTTMKNPQLEGIVRSFSDLGMGIRLAEFNRTEMVKNMTYDSTPNTTQVAHAFNSSNLTKLLVDITIPGIGGIELWQSFLVDRVPNIASKGYFVVTKVTHIFNKDSGWLTKLQGMFRYKST
jgi:hypothetical protein